MKGDLSVCTAVTYRTKDHYFGRTLDYEKSFGEKVVVTPRNFSICFRKTEQCSSHYALIGMAAVVNDYPLYYDATNEYGLSIAGLNFPGNAFYGDVVEDKYNIAPFELPLWILGQCKNVDEAKKLMEHTQIVSIDFREDLKTTPLHWMVADETHSIVIESVENGIKIYDNPVGVLTNNPSFDQQLFGLNNYMHLSIDTPNNYWPKIVGLKTYSRGMGAIGLPGDLSSASRFVRAAFTKMHSLSGPSEAESISQVFHILGSVTQQRGLVRLAENAYEKTIYTSCCNTNQGIYYYKTYDSHRICAVSMRNENLEGKKLCVYPLVYDQEIYWQNSPSH